MTSLWNVLSSTPWLVEDDDDDGCHTASFDDGKPEMSFAFVAELQTEFIAPFSGSDDGAKASLTPSFLPSIFLHILPDIFHFSYLPQ